MDSYDKIADTKKVIKTIFRHNLLRKPICILILCK